MLRHPTSVTATIIDQRVIVRVLGPVTLQTVHLVARALRPVQQGHCRCVEALLDLAGVTRVDLHPAQMQDICQAWVRDRPGTCTVRLALLTGSETATVDVLLYARFARALLRHTGVRIRIGNDAAALERWLERGADRSSTRGWPMRPRQQVPPGPARFRMRALVG